MTFPVYTNLQVPAIDAGNLNSLNNVVQNILGNGSIPPNNASDVRTNIGLGSMAQQNSNAVAITGGSIAGVGTGMTQVPGTLLNIQYLTTVGSGTYTPTAGTTKIIVEGVGGGGGSAGTVAPGSSSLSTVGGAGSAGTWGRKLLTSGFSGASYTVGAGGAAGLAGAAGSIGGTTIFGSIQLPGGPGGNIAGAAGGPSILSAPSTVASAATATDVSVRGGSCIGVGCTLGTGTNTYGAQGGSNPLGTGGTASFTVGANTYAAGVSGTGFGSGASGASVNGLISAAVGVAGQPGIIIVYEYA